MSDPSEEVKEGLEGIPDQPCADGSLPVLTADAAPLCPKCGWEFHMAWIGNDPPEPYGEVCGCPDVDFDDARAEKAAMDAPLMDRLTDQSQ